jgi:lipopolysaccharide export LptBFGC system permease protein LptF
MDISMLKNNTFSEKRLKKSKFSAFLFGLITFVFIFTNSCSAYVTPDWEAQTRNNRKQEVHSKHLVVNYQKQKKNNKKQKAKNKIKINKKKQKNNNKKQKAKNRIKVDKEKQKKDNARQKVK